MQNNFSRFLKPWVTTSSLAVGTLLPGLALAYVGPGAGVSVLGALWGLIAGVVMAVGVILFWPIRMMIRKSKAKKAAAAAAADGTVAAEAADEPAQTDNNNNTSS